MSRFSSEKELAKQVVSWLTAEKWDVWQEVQISSYSHIHDIVAVKNDIIWVVECKLSLCLSVLAQAYYCKIADRRSIAIPDGRGQRRSTTSNFGSHICQKFGIGMLRVSSGYVCNMLDPVPTDKIFPNRKTILETLKGIPRTFCEAGSAKGGYFTAYKATMMRIRKIIEDKTGVSNEPGCTVKDIMDKLGSDHHYANKASANSNIGKALQSFEKEWCRWQIRNNKTYYYLRYDAPT